jgi:Tol biopolymer transport system component
LRDIGEARIVLENPERTTDVPRKAESRPTWIAWVVASTFAAVAITVTLIHFREKPPVEQTLRYTIPPPENSAVNSFAISPDGRYLALATAVNGKRQLWLRTMDGLQFQPMRGTEDAQLPFWSPDSRYIGFFAQLKLKKIAATGGPAQSLCDAGIGNGGTWNTDNEILFSIGGPLQRVQSAGGVPSDVKRSKEGYGYPTFLPEGRRFLYFLAFTGSETQGIYLGSLQDGENRRILADVSSVLFAPSHPGSHAGHLLFRRQNTLMAQPFDATSGQLLGEVFPVAEGITSLTGGIMMPVTVSETGTLVYASGGASAGSQLVWYDRSGKILGLTGAPGILFTPVISPDGKSIAYSRNGSTGADIWLRDGRGIETRFTADPSGNYAPLWSPTGDRIVWVSNRQGALNLYQKATIVSGQDEALLPATTAAVPVTQNKGPDQWSRDGRLIVYSEPDSNAKQHLWVLPVGSTDRKPKAFLKTDFNEVHGQLSPNSAWMAYASDETGQREVYVRSFPSSGGVQRISVAGGDQPRWRGDGKELFYVAADGRMMAVPIKAVTGPRSSFQPGVPMPLFESHIIATPQTNGVFQYDVSADGKRFLVVTNNVAAATPPLTVVVNWNAGLKK